MTMSGSPLSSPGAQAFQTPETPEDEEDLFRQGFQDLAYKAFQKTQPELMGELITFRILDVDPETGSGVGTFIVQHNQDIVFIPCVISENAIKPFDMFFSRNQNRFLPLSTKWLAQATNDQVSQMGSAQQPPASLPTDVDIRNLVVPPTTGRYSYASEYEAATPFRVALEKEKLPDEFVKSAFLEYLQNSSDRTKARVQKLFEGMPKFANHFARYYGAKAIREALHVEKVAEERQPENMKEMKMKQDVQLLLPSMPIQEVRQRLEKDELPLAYKSLRVNGFYVKDDRPNESKRDLFALAERELGLVVPRSPGLYRVWMADGKSEIALVTIKYGNDPWNCGENRYSLEKKYQDAPSPGEAPQPDPGTKFMVFFKDGRCVKTTNRIVAEPVVEASHREMERFVESMTADTPVNGSDGYLISTANLTARALGPFWPSNVSTYGDQTSFKSNGDTIIIQHKLRQNTILPATNGVRTVAGTYRWFKAKHEEMPDLLSDSRQVMMAVENALEKTGAVKVVVKTAEQGTKLMVGTDRTPLKEIEAAVKVARDYGLGIENALRCVVAAKERTKDTLWATKRAVEQLDPNNPMPQGPPPPTGIELATSEMEQNIQQQLAALQQQLQIVQQMKDRAMQIDQGGGQQASPTGAAALAAGGQGGMVNGQQPMAPVGGPPPGTPPPPPPVMSEEEPNPEELQQQVSPQFVEQAAGMQDQGVFDAVAIASLARLQDVQGSMQNYLPSLEKCLDNLGRVLLLLYMHEVDTKKAIGGPQFSDTEQKVRTTFKGLGDAILMILQYSQQLSTPNTQQRQM